VPSDEGGDGNEKVEGVIVLVLVFEGGTFGKVGILGKFGRFGDEIVPFGVDELVIFEGGVGKFIVGTSFELIPGIELKLNVGIGTLLGLELLLNTGGSGNDGSGGIGE